MNAFVTLKPEVAEAEGPEYSVNVYLADDSTMWIAESDALPIATEAPTFEALVACVWDIAPEIADLNGHQGSLNLSFVLHTTARA